MNKWWSSLTDEGQLMLVAIGITVAFGLLTMIATISCYCFGFSGVVPRLYDIYTTLIEGDAGILGLFLGHSATGRVFGKVDNMKDIVGQNQKESDTQ